MKHLFFGSADCGNTPVKYFLLVGTREQDLEEYGVLVERGEEKAEIPGLTFSQRRIQELLDRMCRGVVTPVTARDVAEDWLLSESGL